MTGEHSKKLTGGRGAESLGLPASRPYCQAHALFVKF